MSLGPTIMQGEIRVVTGNKRGHFFNVNSNNPVWVQLQGRSGKLLPPPKTTTAAAATTPTTSTTTTTQA